MSLTGHRNYVHQIAEQLVDAKTHAAFEQLLSTLDGEWERDGAMKIAAYYFATLHPEKFTGVDKRKRNDGTDTCGYGYRIPAVYNVLRNDDIYFADNGVFASCWRPAPKDKSDDPEYKKGSILLPTLPSTIAHNAESRQAIWAKIWADSRNVQHLQPGNSKIWANAAEGVLTYPILLQINAQRYAPGVIAHMKGRRAYASERRSLAAMSKRVEKRMAAFHRSAAKSQNRMMRNNIADNERILEKAEAAAKALNQRAPRADDHSCQPDR